MVNCGESTVSITVQALNDHPFELPFRAVVQRPIVIYRGQPDWVESVYNVENWLERSIGPHYVRWVWSMWSLHQSDLCSVSFARERDSTLFLLKFGS